MARLLAAVAIVVASPTGAQAGAGAPGVKSAWSYGFADSLWTNASPSPAPGDSVLGRPWTPQCLADCGPAFGAYVVRRTELMSSNTADLSMNKALDSTGHAMAMSGMVVIERLEPDGFPGDWVVVGERTLDGDGAHSWSLSPSEVSLGANGLPLDLYRFEGSSFSIDLAAATRGSAGATPEASTWAMILVGAAALGLARYRSGRNERPSILILNRDVSDV